MHYHPELVNLDEAGTGESKPFAAKSLNDKTAWTPRNWLKVSADTGVGDPSLSTAEKGKRFANAVSQKYVQLIRDLAADSIYLD
ncbi:MAG: creatininase family protein, partial [Muribaculaceae bacterium]|nr:creatininase family protein [Muribaculaceae bacterium]